MNKVILSGRIVYDVEKRVTNNNIEVVTNCIAVKQDFKNSNGTYDTDFIKFTCFRNNANYLANYGKKGQFIEIVGRWSIRTYQDNNGQQVIINECVADNVSIVYSPQEEKLKTQEPNYQDIAQQDFSDLNTDDLPF